MKLAGKTTMKLEIRVKTLRWSSFTCNWKQTENGPSQLRLGFLTTTTTTTTYAKCLRLQR